MRKLFFVLLCLNCYLTIAIAQPQFGWFYQNPLPQCNNLNYVRMLNTSTIFAVGDYGMIIKSTNSGTSWTNQSGIDIVSMLMDVSFGDANTGYVVGFFGGLMGKTTDGGATWFVLPHYTNDILHGVSAIDANNVYVAAYDGLVFRTSDGGLTWNASKVGTSEELRGMQFFDINNGVVCGTGGMIYLTTDAGQNWTIVQAMDSIKNIEDIKFVDSNNGIACGGDQTGAGDGFVIRTTNGGLNWQVQLSGLNSYISSAALTSSSSAIAVGFGGVMYRTTNGGSNWNLTPSGTPYTLTSVYFANSQVGTIVSEVGQILRTTNAGANWYYQSSSISYNTFFDCHFFNSTTGIIVGEGGIIFRTTDGGNTWGPQPSNTTRALQGLSFANLTNGVAVGDTGTVITTSNGGTTWVVRNSGTTQNLLGVSYVGTLMYAVGANGTIRRSTDGGVSWTAQTSNTPNTLVGVSFTDASHGTAVGANGTIIRTLNAGLFWISQTSPVSDAQYSGVMFLNVNTGYAVAPNELVIKTTDGGVSWSIKLFGPSGGFLKIFFSDVNNGTIVGGFGFGVIKRTTNGGNNWEEQFINITQPLHGVHFINGSTGWAVGELGLILKTTNGGNPIGIQQINSEVPKEFHLGQNYPNPFNPSTKIKFDVPAFVPPLKGDRGIIVRLIVYDVLGREIITLLNESLKPGTYEVEWDAVNFPSGVYFYSLTADGFSESRKMILIK